MISTYIVHWHDPKTDLVNMTKVVSASDTEAEMYILQVYKDRRPMVFKVEKEVPHDNSKVWYI